MKDDFDDLINDDRRPRRRDYSTIAGDEIDTGTSRFLKDKVTSIKSFIQSLQLTLTGYKWRSDEAKFIYTGEVLCGEEVAMKIVALFQPFTENIALISTKSKETFYRQKYEINTAINEMLLRDMSVHASNHRVILKKCKWTFQTIGEVVLSSKDLIKNEFRSETPQLEPRAEDY